MKKIITYHFGIFLLLSILLGMGCHESPIGSGFTEDYYNPLGAVVNYSNVITGFFDLGDPDNSSISFDLASQGEDVSSVDVLVSYNGATPVPYASLNSLPGTMNVTMNDVLSTIGKEVDDLDIGEDVRFLFDANSTSGKYRSNRSLSVPFSCLSELAGTYDYETTSTFCGSDPLTGEVEIVETGAGVYTFDDWSFGSYQDCYGGAAASWGSLALVDVCNILSVTGVDSYGDSWEIKVDAVDGANLTLSYSNTYGETATSVLTRKDGSNWPPLSN